MAVYFRGGNAENALHPPGGQPPLSREGDYLIEQGLGVAHAPLAHSRQKTKSVLLDLDSLVPGDARELPGDDAGRDPPELEYLTAAQNRIRNLLKLGCGEHEYDVGRGLLKRLEESVERPSREHMHLVDDDGLVAPPRRPVAQPLAKLAHIVHAGIGRCVDLANIGMGAPDDLLARGALIAGLGHRTIAGLAVERLGEDSGGGGFSDAAGPAEEVGRGDAPGPEGIREGAADVLLAEKILETLGTPFSGAADVVHFADLSTLKREKPEYGERTFSIASPIQGPAARRRSQAPS